ncbi:hypothetical protein VNI00_016342 [Paramarasmius palmivorus]|uniref:Uncharacterized protein n=1 Tax=Paramarasmius palmivorus TaxID=297713 RepID=A0AAW0BFY7_9AGAR
MRLQSHSVPSTPSLRRNSVQFDPPTTPTPVRTYSRRRSRRTPYERLITSTEDASEARRSVISISSTSSGSDSQQNSASGRGIARSISIITISSTASESLQRDNAGAGTGPQAVGASSSTPAHEGSSKDPKASSSSLFKRITITNPTDSFISRTPRHSRA